MHFPFSAEAAHREHRRALRACGCAGPGVRGLSERSAFLVPPLLPKILRAPAQRLVHCAESAHAPGLQASSHQRSSAGFPVDRSRLAPLQRNSVYFLSTPTECLLPPSFASELICTPC